MFDIDGGMQYRRQINVALLMRYSFENV